MIEFDDMIVCVCLFDRATLAVGVAIVATRGSTSRTSSSAPTAGQADGLTTTNEVVSTWKCSTCDGIPFWPWCQFASLAAGSFSPSPSLPFSSGTARRPSSRFFTFFLTYLFRPPSGLRNKPRKRRKVSLTKGRIAARHSTGIRTTPFLYRMA